MQILFYMLYTRMDSSQWLKASKYVTHSDSMNIMTKQRLSQAQGRKSLKRYIVQVLYMKNGFHDWYTYESLHIMWKSNQQCKERIYHKRDVTMIKGTLQDSMCLIQKDICLCYNWWSYYGSLQYMDTPYQSRIWTLSRIIILCCNSCETCLAKR